MTKGDARKPSLIERAAEIYDFGAALRGTRSPVDAPAGPPEPAPVIAVAPDAPIHPIAWDALREEALLDPSGSATSLAEEFRIIKRKLLTQAFDDRGDARHRMILVSSAHPGDGKSWVATNLALSLSAERDLEVMLIDADFGKPSLCRRLGLPAGPGIMDALTDATMDINGLALRTELPSLSVIPAGRQVHDDTEILASERTREVLDRLVQGHPRRIVLFDSPPALAASAASELARHVGMVLMVVRADRTSDAALRDAVHLLSACPDVKAVLNGVKFSSSGRLFGAYYGKRG